MTSRHTGWGYVDSAALEDAQKPPALPARAHISPAPTTESQPRTRVTRSDRLGNIFRCRNERKNRLLGNIFI
jgi:hypothetical protein